jgi:hypothetical protein
MNSRTGATRRAFVGGTAATSLAQQPSAAIGTRPSAIRHAMQAYWFTTRKAD